MKGEQVSGSTNCSSLSATGSSHLGRRCGQCLEQATDGKACRQAQAAQHLELGPGWGSDIHHNAHSGRVRHWQNVGLGVGGGRAGLEKGRGGVSETPFQSRMEAHLSVSHAAAAAAYELSLGIRVANKEEE